MTATTFARISTSKSCWKKVPTTQCRRMASGNDSIRARLQEDMMKKRAEFMAAERERHQRVDFTKLSPRETKLHQLHAEAVQDLKFTYDDPYLGLKVLTTYRHTLKGVCCGQACRHCVYQHEGVLPARRIERTFNSSFWRDIQDSILDADGPPENSSI